MARPRILLADDHPQILSLLKTLLEPDYQVVGTANDGRSLIEAARALQPDVVLTDADMPALNGIEAVRQLHHLLPGCRVIVHSSHSEPHLIATALEAGAAAYLIKGTSQSLLSSIRTAVSHVWSSQEALVDDPASAYRPAFVRPHSSPSLAN
jgi:DNA-binding NarL/FixJ family response regulator